MVRTKSSDRRDIAYAYISFLHESDVVISISSVHELSILFQVATLRLYLIATVSYSEISAAFSEGRVRFIHFAKSR